MIRLDAFQPILAGVGIEVQAVAEDMIAGRVQMADGERVVPDVRHVESSLRNTASDLACALGATSRRAMLLRIAGAAAVLLAADECERGSETVEREMAAFNRNRARL